MAKAILAGEYVKEFSCQQLLSLFTAFYAILSRLSKNFFMRYRP